MIIGRDEQLNIPEDATLIVSVEPITVRPEEAAKLLGISRTKVYELMEDLQENIQNVFAKIGGVA